MAAQILLSIAILIISAKIFGEIAERLKLPSLVGEITGGIIAGPFLHLVSPGAELRDIAGLGILFLFFLLGLNIKIDKTEAYSSASVSALAGLLSFGAGFALGFFAFSSLQAAAVTGAVMLVTSPHISEKFLMAAGEYRTKVYKVITSAEASEGFIALLALSMISAFLAGMELQMIAVILAAVTALMVFSLTIGSRITNSFLSLFRFMKDEQIFVAVPLVLIFLASFAGEKAGLVGAAGAFFAGVAMARYPQAESAIAPKIKTIANGFFIPLFFAYAALFVEFSGLRFWLLAALLVFAAASKIAGGMVASALFGFKGRDRKTIGAAMIPGGEYSIVMAYSALGLAAISASLYSVFVIFSLASIVITPALFRLLSK